MVEQIENRALFHVTTTKPYKQSFVVGQEVTVGESHNPYFGFYEGSREYPNNHHGQIVQIKAVQWLKLIQSGSINTSYQMLSNIACEVAIHYVMLARELIMEEIRRDEFNSQPPSRQRCLYACETLDEAKYWRNRLGEGVICELACTGATLRADANLLLGDSEPLSVTKDRARMYWRGEKSAQPELETLFVGTARVVSIVSP